MSRFRLYIALILALCVLSGCVRETLHEMPSVEVVVSWEYSRDQTHSDALFYLYPQFDYLSEMIKVDVIAAKSQKLSLLPGRYKVLMHNTPHAPLVVENTNSFDDLNAYIDYQDGIAVPFDQFMVLGDEDPFREIEVRLGETNRFEFKPISASKKIRFVIEGDENFGQVDIVDAFLTGVVSKINLSTLKTDLVDQIKIAQWDVNDKTFTSKSFEVLGFDTKDKITLNLVIQSPDSDYPKEQPVDLTEELRNLEGDEVLITMEVEYKPDIRVRKISIKEWLAGNEINIDFS